MRKGRFLLQRKPSFSLLICFCIGISYFTSAAQTNKQAVYFEEKIEHKPFEKAKLDKAKEDISYDKEYQDYLDGKKKEKKEEKKDTPKLNLNTDTWNNVFKILAISLLTVVFGALLYFALTGTNIFSPKSRRILNEEYESAIESLQENLHDAKIDEWIGKAIKDNNFSMAIRFYYLKTLQTLSLNNWIKWRKEKTNRHYINELGATPLFEEFQDLTKYFEMAWYGEHPISAKEFPALKERFSLFLEKVKQGKG